MVVLKLVLHFIRTMGQFAMDTFLKPVIRTIQEVRQSSGKPVLLALRPPPDMEGMKEFLSAQEAFADADIPIFYSLGQLARAMARVITWHQNRNQR